MISSELMSFWNFKCPASTLTLPPSTKDAARQDVTRMTWVSCALSMSWSSTLPALLFLTTPPVLRKHLKTQGTFMAKKGRLVVCEFAIKFTDVGLLECCDENNALYRHSAWSPSMIKAATSLLDGSRGKSLKCHNYFRKSIELQNIQ